MRNLLFYILKCSGILFILRKFKGKGITVLCFHRVSNEQSAAWPPLKTEVFEKLIIYIKQHYEVITHLDLKELKSKKPRLILTFDDGYKDFISNALPILEKYDLPSVHSVVVECVENGSNIWTQRLNHYVERISSEKISSISYMVDSVMYDYKTTNKTVFEVSNEIYQNLLLLDEKTRNKHLISIQTTYNLHDINDLMMDWKDLATCISKRVIIGSHSYSHANLSLTKDINKLEKEIGTSKAIIEKKLNIKCDVIAFPNGQYDTSIIMKCKESGYKYLYILNEKLYHHKNGSEVDIIPRLLIQHDTYIENCFKIENFHNIIKSLKNN